MLSLRSPVARFTLGMVLVAVPAGLTFALGHEVILATLAHARTALLGLNALHPARFATAFFAFYVLMAAISFPAAEVITVVAGALFGFAEGVLLVSFASTLGTMLAMLSSRFLLRGFVRQHLGTGLRRFDERMSRESAFYLFSLRLVPAVPFFLVNLLAGVVPLRIRTFWWVSQVGMLPATLVYVNAGDRLGQLSSMSGLLSPDLIGAFALLAALPWLSRGGLRLLRRRRAYRGWREPRHFDCNVVVIGAGAAGLVSADIAVTLRARVTLIEAQKMVGACLNSGCVPSKALVRIARAVHERGDHYARHRDRLRRRTLRARSDTIGRE